MRVLIAGFGNVGRAVDAMVRVAGTSTVSSVAVCDKTRDGCDVKDWIQKNHATIDVVVNLTGETGESILKTCCSAGIDYIDTGMELRDEHGGTLDQVIQRIHDRGIGSRALIGFGMNPGVIEYVYHMAAPAAPHWAAEIEYDSAAWSRPGLFSTWSPLSYFNEAVRLTPYLFRDGRRVTFRGPGNAISLPLTLAGARRVFDLIPHDEVGTIARSNPNCLGCAFLYQAPSVIQEHFKQHGHDLSADAVRSIPIPDSDLTGEDVTGIALSTGASRIGYWFTRGNHAAISEKYRALCGVSMNATNWQVACGVLTALEILPHLKPGAFTASDIAREHAGRIEKTLDRAGLTISRQELDAEEFGWRHIQGLFDAAKTAVGVNEAKTCVVNSPRA